LLQESLPAFEKDLRDLQQSLNAAPAQPKSAPTRTADDLASFAALQAWMLRVRGITMPEAELRQEADARPDGSVGDVRDHAVAASAILAGEQKYTVIRPPVLAIFANPRKPGPFAYNTPAERASAVEWETQGINGVATAFQNGVPSAHVVQVPQANHYVFLSNESDVLREMRAFLVGLN
jgi:non-heme chloroperoxidase